VSSPTDLAPVDPPAVNPLALIQAAVERGIDAAQLERLMDLQERYEKNQAAKVFAAAVAAFQAECPRVYKRRTADTGKMKYQFASMDDVMRAAGPVLAKHGIAVTFPNTEPTADGLRVTCRVRVGCHCEDTPLTIPVPQMVVNDTQRVGAALSYAKRLSLCAALNIVVTDEDDDAASCVQNIDPTQVAEIKRLIAEKNVNVPMFLTWAEVARVEDIALANYPKVVDMLARKKAVPK